MSNLKHFGQHPHSLLMELLASVTWMSSSYDSLDISSMSDKLIYTIFPVTIHGNYSLHMKLKAFGTPCLQSCHNHAKNMTIISVAQCDMMINSC